MRKLPDMTGQRFGLWLVLYRASTRFGKSCWLCRCVCGTEKSILHQDLKVGSGNAGCGCANPSIIHGGTGTREHRAWKDAKSRCYNRAQPRWKDYGGRGIEMDAVWVNDFASFRRDMGPCPAGHSLDRIDNNGNYGPGNCRWATKQEQARNTRRNVLITVNGETHCESEWAKLVGLNLSTLAQRRRRGSNLLLHPARPLAAAKNV
jgi:hypothetical protein